MYIFVDILADLMQQVVIVLAGAEFAAPHAIM